jgi:ribulose kinase
VAVIISTGPVVDFCFMSTTLKALPQLTWLRKGMPVPRSTVTAGLNADLRRVSHSDRVEEEIDVMDWFGGNRSVTATEQAVGLGSYGKTLTVLTCLSLQDETYQDDGGDENEDAERWAPRFLR